jgi:uncharacterized membrane protein
VSARAIRAALDAGDRFFFVIGIIHIRSPDGFLIIMPNWVPYPR